MFLAVLLAGAAAASFAIGSALQHRVAGANSAQEESRASFVLRLIRRPSWLVGLLFSALAFMLHALALREGDLALVQPVIVSGIVFAVLLRSALERRRPPRRTVLWLVLTWAGLALFLAVRPEATDRSPDMSRAVLVMVVGVLLATTGMITARFSVVDRRRGLLLGGAAGVLFGLVAGDVKLVFADARAGWAEALTNWPLWSLVVVGLWAVLLNQRAYQATRLSATTPVLNIAQVLVSISIGLLVFGEGAGFSPLILVGEIVGLGLVLVGVVRLTRDHPSAADEPGES